MKLKRLLEGIEFSAENLNLLDLEIEKITCDSSEVKEKTVFACLVGTNTDGHKFADAAEQKGAAAVLCQRDTGVKNQIIVADTRYAFAKMAANFFGNPSKQLKFIGVTGTNGKTTITKILKTVLDKAGLKVGLIGTIQNEIGTEAFKTDKTTPDPVKYQKLLREMANKGCEYVVMEVSSHALAQKRLADTKFEISAFTNLTQDHLDYHKDMEEYYRAKRDLFFMSKLSVVNADDSYGDRLKGEIPSKVYTISAKNKNADFVIEDIKSSVSGVEFTLKNAGRKDKISFCTPGVFSAYNATIVVAVCKLLGLDEKKTIDSLKECGHVKGRSEVIQTGRDFSVICDYAHSPDGLLNILSSINEYKKGRVVTVFGCGGDRDKSKRPIMGETAALNSDFLVITSDNPRTEDPDKIIDDIVPGVEKTNVPYVRITNRKEAISYAINHAEPNDVILLAGKGHEDYQVLGTKKIDFDERAVVKQILNDIN